MGGERTLLFYFVRSLLEDVFFLKEDFMSYNIQRIQFLEQRILECRAAYYDNNGTAVVDGEEISDSEYDAMEDELRILDPHNTIFSSVGVEVSEKFEKGSHSIPMGSQSKCANIDELKNWYRLLSIKGDFIITHKLDGASLALYYDNGKLQQAITRGDGLVGRIITNNAKKFIGVPITIPFSGKLAIRGEALLSVSSWKKIDSEALNPRNLGTGIMGREDGKDCDKIRFISFDCDTDDNVFSTKSEKLFWMSSLGFEVVPHKSFYYNKSNDNMISLVEQYYNDMISVRNNNAVHIEKEEFWIDGLIFELNDLSSQESLGIVSGRPKFSVALKFPSPSSQTTLVGCEINVGHTGAIVPTGLVNPVEIGGTTVSRVTLNNWEYIQTMDLAIGDTVKIVKAGDIIPKIVSVVTRPHGRKTIDIPDICPVCGKKTFRETNVNGKVSSIIKCSNEKCSAKDIGKIKRFISSLNILEIGDAIIEGMYNAGIVRNVSDIFGLEAKKEEIAKLNVGNGNWGEKRTKTMIDEINKRKEMTLPELLGSLGISGLGKRRVQLIMDKTNGQMDNIDDWTSSKLITLAQEAGVPNLAESICRDILSYKDMIDDILSIVTIKQPEKKKMVSGKLSGSIFVFTGKFSRTEKEISKDIEKEGGEVSDTLNKNTTYLVQADPSKESVKSKKANKLGIKIIDEMTLMSMF